MIALVITIIILLILAGVSITALFGQNGILTQSSNAKKQQAIAAKEEEVKLAILDVTTEENGDTSKVTIPAVVEKIKKNYKDEDKSKIFGESTGNETDKFPGEITYNPPMSTINESIIITIDADLNLHGGLGTPDEFSSLPKVAPKESEYLKNGNIYYYTPDLTGFSKLDTYYITYDSSGNEVLEGRIDRIEAPTNWHDYENKHWGNIVTVHDGKISYWTWIPRFKYKTKDDDDTLQNNFVDAKFSDISGKCKIFENNEDKEIDISSYHLPDAFKFDNTDLKGYWISKNPIQEDKYDDDIHIKESGNKALITVAEPNGTYTLFVNGVKYKNGITLPYKLNINTSKDYQLLLVHESDGKIISCMVKDTLDPSEISVDLSGFNTECTYYVTYDDSGNEILSDGPIQVNEKGEATNAPSNWYDYRNKHWANIATINNEKVSYWTWVPRFQYKSFGDNFVDTTFIPVSKTIPDKGFSLPDAFKFDNVDLKGYWISKNPIKYETYTDQIILTKYDNKTRITTAQPSGTYTIYIDGVKHKSNVTLPYEINKGKDNPFSIFLIRESDKYIISNVAEGILPEEISVDLSGFNTECTYYITYDDSGNEIISNQHVEIDNNGNATNAPSNWYDYRNKHWANIMTNNNGIISYWTWIPRYQYKSFDDNFISTVFIKSDKVVADNNYSIPDAFKFDNVNLKGYWISKYTIREKE